MTNLSNTTTAPTTQEPNIAETPHRPPKLHPRQLNGTKYFTTDRRGRPPPPTPWIATGKMRNGETKTELETKIKIKKGAISSAEVPKNEGAEASPGHLGGVASYTHDEPHKLELNYAPMRYE